MEPIQAIENWMEAVESSSQEKAVKEQAIKEIVDLWKFADSYQRGAILTQKGELVIEGPFGPEKVSVQCSDISLSNKENIIAGIISEIETELSASDSRYVGLYNVEFRNPEVNFDVQELQNLKSEIISGIKGDVILYKYVERIRKMPSSELKIVNRDFKVVACGSSSVEDAIAKSRPSKTISEKKQWLVLILSSIDHCCKSFLIDEAIKSNVFSSDFDRTFIFDFYTTEIIELNTVANVPNPTDVVPKVMHD